MLESISTSDGVQILFLSQINLLEGSKPPSMLPMIVLDRMRDDTTSPTGALSVCLLCAFLSR